MIIYKPIQNISSNPMMFIVTDTNRYIYELVDWTEQAGQSQVFRSDKKSYKKIIKSIFIVRLLLSFSIERM